MGQLVLVRLLMEQYHCDDTLVAPDGQTALRLASQNGRREIVDYLPARRSGGFRRWKHNNRNVLQRLKRSCKEIWKFLKFFIWDVEKFFLWTVPKHTIVEPARKACVWCWTHRKGFVPWCRCQVSMIPGRVKKFGKWVGKIPKRALEAAIDIGKASWRIATETLPLALKDLMTWAWKLLTVKIPKALAILGKWFWHGFATTARAIATAVLRMASWLATMVEAIILFFQRLTLKDIWNGFMDMLDAIFVAFPKVLVSWIEAFGDASYKMMDALFGSMGICIWYLGEAIRRLILFLPRHVWVILESFGEACLRAGDEVRIWLNPKA